MANQSQREGAEILEPAKLSDATPALPQEEIITPEALKKPFHVHVMIHVFDGFASLANYYGLCLHEDDDEE